MPFGVVGVGVGLLVGSVEAVVGVDAAAFLPFLLEGDDALE